MEKLTKFEKDVLLKIRKQFTDKRQATIKNFAHSVFIKEKLYALQFAISEIDNMLYSPVEIT